MFSYQQDFKSDLMAQVKEILKWDLSCERDYLLECKEYYEGKNRFINRLQKLIWSDTAKRLIVNPYAPNYKTYYGFYGNMVNQKINSLFGETPTVKKLNKRECIDFGMAMKIAGLKASSQGYSLIYEKLDGSYKIFDTENCLVYLDDLTNEIKAVIRYWYVAGEKEQEQILYFELYTEDGVTTCSWKSKDKEVKVISKFAYKTTIRESAVSKENIIQSMVIPITIFKNNEKCNPDLSCNIKSKIDMIDLLQSGLCNNLEEFSDVWLTANVADMTEEQAQAVKETWQRTKTLITNSSGSASIQTVEIPYQSRMEASKLLKKELCEDAGVVDFTEINGNSTATEINARTFKLKQKVSDFEWFANDAGEKLIYIYQQYRDTKFEIDITFTKLFITNNLELVNIANSLYGKISNKAFLNILKQANIIEDVDQELIDQQEEGIAKFDFLGDEDESTQGNGQNTEPSEQNI